MTMQSLQAEIEKSNDTMARVERLTSGLTNAQAERLRAIKLKAQVALAKRYGARLNDSIVDKALNELILRPDVLCTVSGGVDESPKTSESWLKFAESIVQGEVLLQQNLIHSDAAAKERIKQDALNKLDGARKIAMARAGTLDAYLDKIVQTELDARASALDE